jgi:hypothetical protein
VGISLAAEAVGLLVGLTLERLGPRLSFSLEHLGARLGLLTEAFGTLPFSRRGGFELLQPESIRLD